MSNINNATIVKAPLVEKYLLEGKLADGRSSLEAHLRKDPTDHQARFGLGILIFLEIIKNSKINAESRVEKPRKRIRIQIRLNVGKYCSGEQRELMGKILIAEDDQNQADAISDVLKREFHTLEVVFDGAEAMDRLRLYHYDLAILDWEMPKYTGIQVLQHFRKNGGKAPVLMLTGMTSTNNKIDGLDSGADDYLTKPFSGAELSARVRALLRRPNETRSPVLALGNLTFDCNKTRLTIDEKEVVLSPLEMKFIEYLLNHANEVVTQETLLDRVWSSESDASSAAIYTCIKAMRKKLQGDANTPVISTVYGMGYRLELKK